MLDSLRLRPHALMRALVPCTLLLSACPGKEGLLTDYGTDGTSTTSTTSTTSDPSSTGNNASTGDAPSTGDASTAGETTSTGETLSTSDASTDDDNGLACELVPLTYDYAEHFGQFEDCGVVDPFEHTAQQWQDARDCALVAVAEQRSFALVTRLVGEDSYIGHGYVGYAAESYGVDRIWYDSWGAPLATVQNCATLIATPGCTVAPGEPCITCVDEGVPSQLCDSP